MNLQDILQDLEYSETEIQVIKQSLRNLSYLHRRKIYELLTTFPEFKETFFNSLLAVSKVDRDGTDDAADEIGDVYEEMLNAMNV